MTSLDAPTKREDFSSLVRWGWALSVLALVFPPLAIGGIIFGALAASRGRPGQGAGMIVLSLLSPFLLIYLASQTLMPS